MNRILVLSLLALTATAYAAPTKQPRTAAQWATLCKNAVPARDLRTTRLISRKGVAPIRATLAANGLSAYKEESVADVLVLHEDGITCSYMNRDKFYQITRRPHQEENGQFVIGDYADGVAFTDPARTVPQGTMWGAKKIGVEVYLPVQLGVCDRDLATCSAAYAEVSRELAVVAVCKQYNMLFNPTTGKCATDAEMQVIGSSAPAPQATTPASAPATPVVAGTVKPIGSSFKARIGFMMIAVAFGLGVLYQRRRYSRLLNKAVRTYKQSHYDMHRENVRLRTERDEAHRERDLVIDDSDAAKDESVRLHRELAQIRWNFAGEREAALRMKAGYDDQLAQLRKGLRDAIASHERNRTDVVTAQTARDNATQQAARFADDLRATQSERDEAVSQSQEFKGLIDEMSLELISFQQQLEAAHAENHQLVEAEVGNGHAELDALKARYAQNTTDALRKECNRLRDQLAIKGVELVLADRFSGADGPEGTFARSSGIEQRVDDLDARMEGIETIEAAMRAVRAQQEALAQFRDHLATHKYARPTSKRCRVGLIALNEVLEAVRGVPMPATA